MNGLLGRAPRWVKKLVAGLITVAGAVAGAFTGGVAAGLAIAGAVLILAGDAVSKLLVKAGVDPDKAMWVGFAVKIVGTALSLGAGAAGGAASAAGTASQAVRTATQVIDTATKVATTLSAGAQLGLDATAAAFNYQADRASAPPTLTRRTPSSAMSRSVSSLVEPTSRLSGRGATPATSAAMCSRLVMPGAYRQSAPALA